MFYIAFFYYKISSSKQAVLLCSQPRHFYLFQPKFYCKHFVIICFLKRTLPKKSISEYIYKKSCFVFFKESCDFSMAKSIIDNVSIIRKIGQGGFTVYLVKTPKNEFYALKRVMKTEEKLSKKEYEKIPEPFEKIVHLGNNSYVRKYGVIWLEMEECRYCEKFVDKNSPEFAKNFDDCLKKSLNEIKNTQDVKKRISVRNGSCRRC